MQQFFGLPFSGDVRRKILWDNCARLYNIQAPAPR
jgi:predicted TIM-barrel fold metal-dependent hydrolase